MLTTRSGFSFDPSAFYQVQVIFDPAALDGPATPYIPAADLEGYVSPIYDPTYVAPELPASPDCNGVAFGAVLFPLTVEADLRYRIAYPDLENLEPVPSFVAGACKISRFDPDFAAKIKALA
jgi:hypothetical protein